MIDTADLLVLTDDLEGSAGLVVDELSERNVRALVLSTARLADGDVQTIVRASASRPQLTVVDESASLEVTLSPGERVFRRQPAPPTSVECADPGVAVFVYRQYRSALNSLFSFELDWMNDAAADSRLDQNKPYGNALADRAGLATIPTVLTDSPAAFLAAVSEFGRAGDICLKSAAAWAAEIPGDRDSVTAVYTVRLPAPEAAALADAVRAAPLLVQPYIHKQYELRVTIVGREIFACRIDSQASERSSVDWRRYDFASVSHEVYRLPGRVENALRRFMSLAGLKYAAVDMIRTRSGEYLFVEANPAGQFGWIEALTGQRICASIVDWMVGSDRV